MQNIISCSSFDFGAALWSRHFLTVLTILTHTTWAPVLFGWRFLAQFLLSEWDQPLFRASWELCYRQLYLSLISPLPQSLVSPSPPSHHRTLLHHACNYGATGEMSVAQFSLAVRDWERSVLKVFGCSGLVTPLAVEPELWWSWSSDLIVESPPLSLVRTCHLCFDFSPYVTICLFSFLCLLRDMTFNLSGHLSLLCTVCSFFSPWTFHFIMGLNALKINMELHS